MFISPAFAQEANVPVDASGGVSATTTATDAATTAATTSPLGSLSSILIFIPILAIMYFLVIRPQSQRTKAHREMLKTVRRGDTVVTSGGIIGKVSKVIDDNEVQVEIAEGTRVRIVRSMIAEIRSRTEPVKQETAKTA